MATFTIDQLNHVADVLMAAAYADGEVDKTEGKMVRDILAAFAGTAATPASIEARIRAFDPATFDIAVAARALALTESTSRRALLLLVAKVTESDDVHDLRESDYIVRVARAIGAQPSDYAGLTVELMDATTPPPVPTEARRKG